MDQRLFQIVLVRTHAEGAAEYRDHVAGCGGRTFNRGTDTYCHITKVVLPHAVKGPATPVLAMDRIGAMT